MHVEMRPIESIRPYEGNPRHNDEAVDAVAASIKAFGFRQPIVVGPKIKNVPKEGYYAWDPGGYIGLYQPDTFWVAQ